jgi:hypothetical protein
MKIDDAINLAIENILKEGLTDVDAFSRPFELDMLKEQNFKEEVTKEIKKSLSRGNGAKELAVTPITHVLVPKKELFDFRKCALVQPLDEIKYLSLVLQIARYIEQMRIDKSKEVVFSYRFKPENGYLFDSKSNYTTFRQYVSKKSKKSNINVVVSCDIGNFYDRLNLHRIESILRSNSKIPVNIISQINSLLLFWSNRDSYGLPVGSNASRILAEASLIEVDNYLMSKKISFCRFVDDYRLFAKDAATAHHWLSLLVDKLNKEGLFLNTSKTKIQDVSDFGEVKQEEDDNDNSENRKEHTEINQHNHGQNDEECKFNIPKIIRGYSGLIPTKFRKLTAKETTKLLTNDIEKLYHEIEKSIIIDPISFVEIIKTAIAQKSVLHLISTVKTLNKFPQFLPYLLDAITKYEDLFSDENIKIITNELEKWLEEDNYSEYILVYLVRFFGRGKFTNKELLFKYFRSLKRNSGHYIGRAVLEELEKLVSRGEVLEIRDYYLRADLWEKRQIAKIISVHISDGEKNPFFKNILSQSDDIFLSYLDKIISKKSKK